MLECFDGEYMIQQQASENIWLGRIADIGEELWMYSQNRECLIDEEDKPYLSGNLNEIKNRIDVMIKGLEQDASPDILSAVKELCLAVYEGDSFNDEKYNELIACIQSTANWVLSIMLIMIFEWQFPSQLLIEICIRHYYIEQKHFSIGRPKF